MKKVAQKTFQITTEIRENPFNKTKQAYSRSQRKARTSPRVLGGSFLELVLERSILVTFQRFGDDEHSSDYDGAAGAL